MEAGLLDSGETCVLRAVAACRIEDLISRLSADAETWQLQVFMYMLRVGDPGTGGCWLRTQWTVTLLGEDLPEVSQDVNNLCCILHCICYRQRAPFLQLLVKLPIWAVL